MFSSKGRHITSAHKSIKQISTLHSYKDLAMDGYSGLKTCTQEFGWFWYRELYVWRRLYLTQHGFVTMNRYGTCWRGIFGCNVNLHIFVALDMNIRLIHDIIHPFTRFNLIYLSGFAAIFIVTLFSLTSSVHKVTFFIQFLWLTIGFRKRIFFFTIVPILIKSNSIEKLDFEMQYAIHLFVASICYMMPALVTMFY